MKLIKISLQTKSIYNLTFEESIILSLIAQWPEASNYKISDDLGMSLFLIRKSIKVLAEKGLITIGISTNGTTPTKLIKDNILIDTNEKYIIFYPKIIKSLGLSYIEYALIYHIGIVCSNRCSLSNNDLSVIFSENKKSIIYAEKKLIYKKIINYEDKNGKSKTRSIDNDTILEFKAVKGENNKHLPNKGGDEVKKDNYTNILNM